MKLRYKVALCLLCILGFTVLFWSITRGDNFRVFNPAGTVANQEYHLMLFTLYLSVVVVLPVFVMLFFFAWKYRAGTPHADYKPDWDTNLIAEGFWWGIPILIIGILSVMAWRTSHTLDPATPLSAEKPLTIQVVALDWKWLFIYPDQGIATVNTLEFPVNQPVKFEVTADAPMNSFWIPELGSQIYAMPGMSTQVNLEADRVGEFQGVSANISGEGFAGMKFMAHAVSTEDFGTWVETAKDSEQTLDQNMYTQLEQPSENDVPAYYSLGDVNLYDNTVMKYMMAMPSPAPSATPAVSATPDMSGMDMSNMQM